MAAELAALSQLWRSFDIRRLLEELDHAASELLLRQSESDCSRKKLVEQSREFKKNAGEEVWSIVAPLLKSFQAEIDSLSRRSRAAEAEFLRVYKRLIDLPDPTVTLERAALALQQERRAAALSADAVAVTRQASGAAACGRAWIGGARTGCATCSRSHVEGSLAKDPGCVDVRNAIRECEHGKPALSTPMNTHVQSGVQHHREKKPADYVLATQRADTSWERPNCNTAATDELAQQQQQQTASTGSLNRLAITEHALAIMKKALEKAHTELLEMKVKYNGTASLPSPGYDDHDITLSCIQRLSSSWHGPMHESQRESPHHPSCQQARHFDSAIGPPSLPAHRVAADGIGRGAPSSEQRVCDDGDHCEVEQLVGCGSSRSSELLDGSEDNRRERLHRREQIQFDGITSARATSLVDKTPSSDKEQQDRGSNSQPRAVRCSAGQLRPADLHNGSGCHTEKSGLSGHAQWPWSSRFVDSVEFPHGDDNSCSSNCSSTEVAGHVSLGDGMPDGSHNSSTECSGSATPPHRLLPACSSSTSEPVGSRGDGPDHQQQQQQHEGLPSCVSDCVTPTDGHGDTSKEALDTADVSSKVKEILSCNSIGQRLFAKQVLGLSQGTVSELLSKPKHWDKLTEKGRESYRKMHQWLSDEHSVDALKSLSPRRSSGPAPSSKSDSANTEERISQILREAQTAMQTRRLLEEQNMQANAVTDATETINPKVTKPLPLPRTTAASGSGSSICTQPEAASVDSLSEAMVSRIYEEELLKLATQASLTGNMAEYGLYQAELRRLSEKRWHAGDVAATPSRPEPSAGVSCTGAPSSATLSASDDAAVAAGDVGRPRSTDTRASDMDDGWQPRCTRSKAIKDEPPDETDDQTGQAVRSPAAHDLGRCGSSSSHDLPAPQDEPVDFTMDRRRTEQQQCRQQQPQQLLLVDQPLSLLQQQQQRHWPGLASPPTAQPLLRDSRSLCHGGSDDGGAMSASPLHKMQNVAHVFLSSSQAHLLTAAQKPLRVVLPPITQDQFEKYSNVCTEDLVCRVKKVLSDYSISQRLFGESVLGLSQGSVSDLLARPKPWSMLTQKGREPFIRMHIFVDDPLAVKRLMTNQYHAQQQQQLPPPLPSDKLLPPSSSARSPMTVAAASAAVVDSLTAAAVRLPSRPAAASCALPTGLCVAPHAVNYAAPLDEFNGGIHANTTWRRTPLGICQSGSSSRADYSPSSAVPALDTLAITSRVKDVLCYHGIGQKLFGEAVLGLSQGSVSDMLSKPKPWELLSVKGREPFVKMHYWLSDPYNVERLQALQAEVKASRKTTSADDSSSDRSSPCIKKARYSFTDEQKHVLRSAFAQDPYPTSASIDGLAQRMGLGTKTVINWFHNHRMRSKQQLRDEDDRHYQQHVAAADASPPAAAGGAAAARASAQPDAAAAAAAHGRPVLHPAGEHVDVAAPPDAWLSSGRSDRLLSGRAGESPHYSGDDGNDSDDADGYDEDGWATSDRRLSPPPGQAPSSGSGGRSVETTAAVDDSPAGSGGQPASAVGGLGGGGGSSSSRKRKSSHPQYVHQGRDLDHCDDKLALLEGVAAADAANSAGTAETTHPASDSDSAPQPLPPPGLAVAAADCSSSSAAAQTVPRAAAGAGQTVSGALRAVTGVAPATPVAADTAAAAARREKLDFIARMELLTKASEVDWEEGPDRKGNIDRLERNLSSSRTSGGTDAEWDI